MKLIRPTLAAVALSATLFLAACGEPAPEPSTPETTSAAPSASATSAKPKPSETETEASSAPASTAESSPEKSATEKAEVPNVVGMNHGDAQELLRSNGFLVNEEDASPEGRFIIDNSGWKVCRQDPGPGMYPVGTRVAIYSVKLAESC